MKVEVALEEGASDRGAASTRDSRDDLLQREIDEADVVGGRVAGGVDEFRRIQLRNSLSPAV
jgi:hypothetical protein